MATKAMHPWLNDYTKMRDMIRDFVYKADAPDVQKTIDGKPDLTKLTPEQRLPIIRAFVEKHGATLADAEQINRDIETKDGIEAIASANEVIGEESDKFYERHDAQEIEIGFMNDFFVSYPGQEPNLDKFMEYLQTKIKDKDLAINKKEEATALFKQLDKNRTSFVDKFQHKIVEDFKNMFLTDGEVSASQVYNAVERIKYLGIDMGFSVPKSGKTSDGNTIESFEVHARIGKDNGWEKIRTVNLDEPALIGSVDGARETDKEALADNKVTMQNPQRIYQNAALIILTELGFNAEAGWNPEYIMPVKGDRRDRLLEAINETHRFKEKEADKAKAVEAEKEQDMEKVLRPIA